jgi:hypothetical protein
MFKEGAFVTEIRILEFYYSEFHCRKGVLFDDADAIEVYKSTQEFQKNWPKCATDPSTPPEVGMRNGLYYTKFKFLSAGRAQFRICFGVQTNPSNNVEIVALTCRTRQELSGGNTNGDVAWYSHMDTIGKSRWNQYRKGLLTNWKIY